MAQWNGRDSRSTYLKETLMALYQQGDVLIETVTIPIGAVPTGQRVLAEGEATGHTHRVEGDAQMLAMGEEIFLRALSGDVRVIHEEHRPVALPPGGFRSFFRGPERLGRASQPDFRAVTEGLVSRGRLVVLHESAEQRYLCRTGLSCAR